MDTSMLTSHDLSYHAIECNGWVMVVKLIISP